MDLTYRYSHALLNSWAIIQFSWKVTSSLICSVFNPDAHLDTHGILQKPPLNLSVSLNLLIHPYHHHHVHYRINSSREKCFHK